MDREALEAFNGNCAISYRFWFYSKAVDGIVLQTGVSSRQGKLEHGVLRNVGVTVRQAGGHVVLLTLRII